VISSELLLSASLIDSLIPSSVEDPKTEQDLKPHLIGGDLMSTCCGENENGATV
jgi:hypothetical protein